jgi:hypothetical protein
MEQNALPTERFSLRENPKPPAAPSLKDKDISATNDETISVTKMVDKARAKELSLGPGVALGPVPSELLDAQKWSPALLMSVAAPDPFFFKARAPLPFHMHAGPPLPSWRVETTPF